MCYRSIFPCLLTYDQVYDMHVLCMLYMQDNHSYECMKKNREYKSIIIIIIIIMLQHTIATAYKVHTNLVMNMWMMYRYILRYTHRYISTMIFL